MKNEKNNDRYILSVKFEGTSRLQPDWIDSFKTIKQLNEAVLLLDNTVKLATVTDTARRIAKVIWKDGQKFQKDQIKIN